MEVLRERNIATIALKAMAIYIFIQSIKYISYFISTLYFQFVNQDIGKSLITNMIIASLAPAIILMILGLILWVKAKKIAEYMVICEDVDDRNVNVEELQSAAFSVVGLVILVDIVKDLPKFIFQIMKFKGSYILLKSTTGLEIKISIVIMVIRFAIGLILFLKSRGIVGLIKGLRKAGLNSIEEKE